MDEVTNISEFASSDLGVVILGTTHRANTFNKSNTEQLVDAESATHLSISMSFPPTSSAKLPDQKFPIEGLWKSI